MRMRYCVLIPFLFLAMLHIAVAGNGTFIGEVTDGTCRPMAAVAVIVTDQNGIARSTYTNTHGIATLALPDGIYNVSFIFHDRQPVTSTATITTDKVTYCPVVLRHTLQALIIQGINGERVSTKVHPVVVPKESMPPNHFLSLPGRETTAECVSTMLPGISINP